MFNARGSLTWVRAYPFKWPACCITAGLCCLFCGGVLLLVSAGAVESLWVVLGFSFLSAGILMSVVGSICCVLSVRRAARNVEVYGNGRDPEGDTCVSDQTEAVR